MPSPYAIRRNAHRNNEAERMVSQIGRIPIRDVWQYYPPKSSFITGGCADQRASAINSIIDRLADESALPVIVLSGRGSVLNNALRERLPEDICLTQPSGNYDYLYGLSIERMHTLLCNQIKDSTGEGQVSDWAWPFLRAVETVNPLSIASMKMLAQNTDSAIAAYAQYSGIPSWEVLPLKTCTQGGHLVRSFINDLAYKLPDSICRSTPYSSSLNIQHIADDALSNNRPHVILLNAAADSSQQLLNAVFAGEISELLSFEIPMALVFDGVEMCKDDPLIPIIHSLINSPYSAVCVSVPTPSFIPGGIDLMHQCQTQLLFPYGDIGNAASLHDILTTYGKYCHTDVNRSAGGRPIRIPFDRHDHVSTATRERPVLTVSDCHNIDAIFSGFIGGSDFDVFLIRQLISENY